MGKRAPQRSKSSIQILKWLPDMGWFHQWWNPADRPVGRPISVPQTGTASNQGSHPCVPPFFEWLPDMGSNHDWVSQSHQCYHYTIGQEEGIVG